MRSYEVMAKPLPPLPIWEDRVFDIGGSRQALTELGLRFKEVEYFLYIDDDMIIVDPYSLMYMHNFLETKKQYIISGLYWGSQPQGYCKKCRRPTHIPLILDMTVKDGEMIHAFPFERKNLTDQDMKSVRQVGAVPGGFLLVKREVFEKVKPPWFVFASNEMSKTGKVHGEDMYFSWKARQAGFKLWLDCRTRLLQFVPEYVGHSDTIKQFLMEENNMDRQIQTSRKELKKK